METEKGGQAISTSDKELNSIFLDQLSIVERLDRAYQEGCFEKEKDIILKEINRKLYQEPPRTDQ